MKVLANDGISKSGVDKLESNGFEVITNKVNQEEWIFFTLIFIFSFTIVLLLNIVINFSIPELIPTFFHIGITLILFPIINIGINFFSFVTQFIKS